MRKTQHVLFAPVYGLKLGAEVSGEIALGRVTFIDAAKISRVRSRIGLKNTVAYYRGEVSPFGDNLFRNADTYAYLRTNREKKNKDYSAELNKICDAFWLMASSFFCIHFRQDATLSLHPVQYSELPRDVSVFERTSNAFQITFGIGGPYRANCRTDVYWKKSIKHCHFYDLSRILNGKVAVDSKWKHSLVRAAILAGQSYLARHVAEAFMNDMIAIETLLSKRGDKFPETLITRLMALFGWLPREDRAQLTATVKRLYKLRCSYVHDGCSGDITGMNLFEADTLLQNVLHNLCRHTKHITCKADVIALADELSAREILGMKPKRGVGFSYGQTHLSPDAKKKIDDTASWSW